MNLRPRRKKASASASACKRLVKESGSHLPDEIVTDILRRLPAEDVLRFRSVCRRFNQLTTTQSFVESHQKHSLPMILVVGDKTEGTHLACEIEGKRGVIHRFAGKNLTLFSKYCLNPESVIRFSLNGFVVSDHLIGGSGFRSKILVLNPINGHHVIISIRSNTDIHGVYFHPLLKEYCTLWSNDSWSKHVDEDEEADNDDKRYQVLNLGPSKPCWKKIKNLTGVGSETYCRVWAIAPVFIDKYLYWAIASVFSVGQGGNYYHSDMDVALQVDIMEFDIISDELKLIACPVVAAFKAQDRPGHRLYCNANLLNLEGCLSIVQINKCEDLVDVVAIWTLRDRVGHSWDFSSYRINLDMYPNKLQLENRFSQAICAVNGSLAIKSGSTLVVYNLKSGTMRNLGKRKYDTEVFFSHLASLASLKNCKTNLRIDTSHLHPPDTGRSIWRMLRNQVR